MQICARYHDVEVFPFVPVIATDVLGKKGCLNLINLEISFSRSLTIIWLREQSFKKLLVIIVFKFFEIASFKYDNLKCA